MRDLGHSYDLLDRSCGRNKYCIFCLLQVYGLPTLMLFRDGKKVDASHREGAITKPKLLQYLEQHGIAAPAVK